MRNDETGKLLEEYSIHLKVIDENNQEDETLDDTRN